MPAHESAPICEVGGADEGGVADAHAVVQLVLLPQAPQDAHRLRHARRVHKHLQPRAEHVERCVLAMVVELQALRTLMGASRRTQSS